MSFKEILNYEIWPNLTRNCPFLGTDLKMNLIIIFCVQNDAYSTCHTALMQHFDFVTLFDLTLTLTLT